MTLYHPTTVSIENSEVPEQLITIICKTNTILMEESPWAIIESGIIYFSQKLDNFYTNRIDTQRSDLL